MGYNIYYGQTNGVYSYKQSVTANSVMISGLAEGNTYYFVATAYDAAGMESVPSGQISYTVPGTQLIAAPVPNGNGFALKITSSSVVRPAWTLQTSSDLKTWSPLSAGSNSVVQVTITNTTAPAAFFRLTSS